MKNCNKCGTENLDDAEFCTSCGSILNESQEKECPFCGAPNKSDAVFCTKCGAKFNNEHIETSLDLNDVQKPPVSSRGSGRALSYSSYDIKTLVMGILSIVLPIIGFFIFGWLSFIGFVLGVLCVVIASLSPKNGLKDVPGVALGVVGTILSIIGSILYIIVLIALFSQAAQG